MYDELQKLKAEVEELKKQIADRDRQQIKLPLDVASKTALGVPFGEGAGSATLTQSVAIAATPTSISVPAAYAGTFFLVVNGTRYEIPYIT